MKGLIFILFVLFSVNSFGQIIKGYRVESKTEIRLDTSYTTSETEPIGALYWGNDRTVDIVLGNGVILQVGQENLIQLLNNSGDTLKDARVVGYNGVENGVTAIKYASKNERHTFLGMTTEEILPDSIGYVVNLTGRVHASLLAGYSPAPIYLDTLGYITNTRPAFPDYVYPIGIWENDSTIIFRSTAANFRNSILDAFDGAIRETFDFNIFSNGTNVYGVLSNPTGDTTLTLMFSDNWWDFIVPDTIVLTAGTSTNPQTSEVYIDKATRTLQSSISGFPSDEHAEIAKIALLDAATTQSNGALKNQNINNHLKSTEDNGHMVHIADRIRTLYAEYEDGISLSVSGTPDSLLITTTSGHVWQLHLHLFPSFDLPTDTIYIVNDPISPYRTTSDMADIDVYSDGSTWNNEWQNLVIWGVANETGETSHLMCNLSSAGYLTEQKAIEDANSYSNYTIPRWARGVGFLIARITVRRDPTGFTFNSPDGLLDLRGYIPNNTAGGGAGGSSGYTLFTQLDDTPNSYSGNSGYFINVTASENGIEFKPQSDFLLSGFDSTGFTLNISQIIDLGDSLLAHRTDIIELFDSIVSYNNRLTTLESSSHPTASLSSDDTAILDLNAGTQAFTFVSSNIAKLDAVSHNFTGTGDHVFSGSVGIGTLPSAKLEVYSNTSYNYIASHSDGVDNSVQGIVFVGGSYNRAIIRGYNTNTTEGGLSFSTYSGTSENERMRILPSGNVGIKTATPSSALDVNGDINASTSYKLGTSTLYLDAHKSGSLGTAGQFYISAGTTTTPVWTNQSSINISGFNNDAGYLTSEVDGSVTNELNDSVKIEGGSLKIYEAGSSIPDSVINTIFNITDGTGRLQNDGAGNWSYDNNTYLQSYTETDPVYSASSWFSTTNNSTNWNTAYSWGDWSTGVPSASMSFTNKTGNISMWTNDAGYLTDLSPALLDTTYLDVSDTFHIIQGGTDFKTLIPDGYISNVTESSNSISFTGQNGAFNSSIGNIAKINYANTFSTTQNFGSSPSDRTSISNGAISMTGTNPGITMASRSSWYDYSTVADLYTTTYWQIRTNGARTLSIKDDGIYGNLDNASTGYSVYYNTSTNEFTYAVAPTGTTNLSFSGASSPVTLASSTGTDVTITAGTNISLSATSGNLTINSTAGTGYWETYASGIRPTSSAYETYLGGITDQGAYILQGTGNMYWNGSINSVGTLYNTGLIQATAGLESNTYIFGSTDISSDNTFTGKELGVSPSTPSTGYGEWYVKTDGKMYFKNDGGTEYDLTSAGIWLTDTYGITYTAGNVGIGASSQSAFDLYVLGPVKTGNYIDVNYLALTYKASTPAAIASRTLIYSNTAGEPYLRQADGDIFTFDITSTSDFWKKKDFRPIHNPLGKILSLNTYAFNWKNDVPEIAPTGEINIKVKDDDEKREATGVIAQEIEKIIPEVVKTMPETGYKAVDYKAIVPYLIGAIQEQQKQINELKKQLKNK